MPCGCQSKAKDSQQATQTQQVAERRRNELVAAREAAAKEQAKANAKK